jgi:hypothetical protein
MTLAAAVAIATRRMSKARMSTAMMSTALPKRV